MKAIIKTIIQEPLAASILFLGIILVLGAVSIKVIMGG